jgi:hypothetical protein
MKKGSSGGGRILWAGVYAGAKKSDFKIGSWAELNAQMVSEERDVYMRRRYKKIH